MTTAQVTLQLYYSTGLAWLIAEPKEKKENICVFVHLFSIDKRCITCYASNSIVEEMQS